MATPCKWCQATGQEDTAALFFRAQAVPGRADKAAPQCAQPPLPAAQGQPLTYILAPPDFDGPVLGGGVEQAIAPPLHTGHRLRVAREDFVTPAHQRVPDADAAVLGGAGQVTALWVSGQRDQIHLCSSPELLPHQPQRIQGSSRQ